LQGGPGSQVFPGVCAKIMAIEVTSVPDSRRVLSTAWLSNPFHSLSSFARKSLVLRTFIGLIAVGAVLGGDALVRSYKHYSRIIDARLASGYLTSRPGIYAAPRVLKVGQKLSQEELVKVLRRAGYLESNASDVWSGSFIVRGSFVEIQPNRVSKSQPKVVRVGYLDKEIVELNADGAPIESFTLEPEALSNDASTKAGKREALKFEEIPPVLVHAILAIEDRRFFEHSGVDVTGLTRAVLRNLGEERFGQGGSTITQQLVKNTYLSPEKTLQRKYAEAMLSIALEKRLDKRDIFALYCNEIYLGQRGAVAVRGVNEASRVFFGKKLNDITLAEAATLAGMIQGPTRYSPLRHADAAVARRNMVLEAMQRDGSISANEATAASAAPLTVAPMDVAENQLAPYFVDYVNRVAEHEFVSGATQRIYTTIDLELQQLAETALKNQLAKLTTVPGAQRPQAALVALDPLTGDVLAMVGGRDYAESQLNRATDANRQPGSTFKPFVYAAAIEDGFSPVQMFMDAPREFVYDRNKVYTPANYGGGYSMREVTMRTGLVRSLNVVTVDLALQTGLSRIANLATRFGLPKPERYPSLALGVEEATPLQMASAYSVFVNNGQRVEPRVIASVNERTSSQTTPAATQVISPTTAYMMTNMLAAVIDKGTAKKARGAVKGTAIAGKTGTSRDGWFIGYSPNLVCAVWIGFDDNTQLGLTGADAALPAWVEFMSGAMSVRPDLGGTNFECPEGIKFVEIDSSSGLISTVTCPLRELIAVTDRTTPNMECYFHGNLPSSGSPFAEEIELTTQEAVVAQHSSKPKKLGYSEWSPYRTTRVDVDPRGRKSLVNEMR
jgi:penicillin-binding protein 1B